MKYMRIICFLCILIVIAGVVDTSTIKSQPVNQPEKGLSQKQKDLLYNAFAAIHVDSGAEYVDIEADVRAALNAGISPNSRDQNGDTLLMQAIEHNCRGVVRMLFERGANVNLRNLQTGETSVHRIITSAQSLNFWIPDVVQTLELLLKHGPHVNARDSRGYTPLMLAAASGHDKIVEKLLAAGADFRLKDKWGETALQMARAPIYVGQEFSANYPSVPPVVIDTKTGMKTQLRLDYSDKPKITGVPLEKYARTEAQRIQRGRIRIIQMLRRAGAKE